MTTSRHRVNVLTAGFTSPNGRAFLMPLILHRGALRDAGLDIRITRDLAAAARDCDILLIDGRTYSARWKAESDAIMEELERMRAQVRHLVYVSIADSAGFDHARPLPVVSLYCKSQLLRDRREYLRPLYGQRIFTDYYHRAFGVMDSEPVQSEPITDPALFGKLAVSWNSGLADYSLHGPLRMKAYQYLPLRALLRFPDAFTPPSTPRRKDLSCRIGTRYVRESVAFQRKRIAAMLSTYIETGKLSRRHYIEELAQSRIAVSPFGLGEITLRDFEIFMSGALLLKPDMSGIETWPDVFRGGETMAAHRWDLSDLQETIEALIADPAQTAEVAAQGQRVYREHLTGPRAGELFARHILGIVARCEALRAH